MAISNRSAVRRSSWSLIYLREYYLPEDREEANDFIREQKGLGRIVKTRIVRRWLKYTKSIVRVRRVFVYDDSKKEVTR